MDDVFFYKHDIYPYELMFESIFWTIFFLVEATGLFFFFTFHQLKLIPNIRSREGFRCWDSTTLGTGCQIALAQQKPQGCKNGEHRGAKLGGGFKYFLLEMIPFDEYFSDGLVQPPTSKVWG